MVLRTLLKPRWMVSLVVLLAMVVAFFFLGSWQLDVARDAARGEALREAVSQPVVPLDSLVAPQQPFPDDGSNRRVSAVGQYEPAHQVLVVDRRLDGTAGSWVVTPLVVEGTGARLAVVRGFVAGDTEAPAVAAAPVQVMGSLAPAESPASDPRPLAKGQLASVDLAHLVNVWDGPIYNAFVFAIAEEPELSEVGPTGSATEGEMERVPPPDPAAGLSLRNAAYALQWWLFGGFFLWLWWRMVRDDHRRDVEAAAADPHPEDPHPEDPHPTDPRPGESIAVPTGGENRL